MVGQQAVASYGTIDVVLAGEDPLVLRGLRSVFEHSESVRVVGECLDAETTEEALAKHKPDILLVTTSFLSAYGVDLIARVRESFDVVRVVLTGPGTDLTTMLRAVEEGAFGFVPSRAELADFEKTLKYAVVSDSPVMPDIASQLLFHALSRKEGDGQDNHSLTPREYEVLTLMVQGLSNKEIGAELDISLGTVKAHVSNVLRKLKAADRTQAVVKALRDGIVEG